MPTAGSIPAAKPHTIHSQTGSRRGPYQADETVSLSFDKPTLRATTAAAALPLCVAKNVIFH